MAILTIKSAANETAVVEQTVLELAKINDGNGGEIELAISTLDQQVIDSFIPNIDAICRVISCIAPPLYTKLVLPADFWQQISNLVSILDKDLAITKIIDAIPADLPSIDIHHLIHPLTSLGYIDLEPMLKKLATKGAKELCLPDGAIKIACKNKLKFQGCQKLILSSDDALGLDIDTSLFEKVMMWFPSLNEIKIINDFSADYNKRIEESLKLKILARKADQKLALPDGLLSTLCYKKMVFKRCKELVLSSANARQLNSDESLLSQVKDLMPSLAKISLTDSTATMFEKSLNLKILATKRDKKLILPIGSIDIICSNKISFKSCREVILSLTEAKRLDSDAELLKQIKRSMPALTKISIADGNDEACVKSLNSKVKPRALSFLGTIPNRANETNKTRHKRNRSISDPTPLV